MPNRRLRRVFNLSGSEIIVILLLALVILGPEKLPEAMRKAGRAYSELRKMANSFQSEVRSVIDEPMNELRGTADMLRDATDFSGDTKKGAAKNPAAGAGPPRPQLVRSRIPATAALRPPRRRTSTVEPVDPRSTAPTTRSAPRCSDDETAARRRRRISSPAHSAGTSGRSDPADEAGPQA